MHAPAYACAQQLQSAPNLRHGFFGRDSGAEQDLNMSENFGDPAEVSANLSRAAMALCASGLAVAQTKQTHSNKVISITKDADLGQRPEADGMVTNQRGIVLTILTADCCPLVFADPERNVIGACHAGWRGAVNGIIGETIAQMVRLGAEIDNIVSAIGPTISGQNYEVGPAFAADMTANFPKAAPFLFTPDNKSRAHFDLPAFAAAEVQKTGAQQPAFVGQCTLAHPARYFSHRGASNQLSAPGRQATMIALV